MVATGIYTIIGGLSAVIYTELMQTLVLLAGAVVLTFIGLSKVGGFDGPARRGAGALLQHDEADGPPGVPVDRHLPRRADPRHLVLVHRPGDRAAGAVGEGRRPREGGHDLRRASSRSCRCSCWCCPGLIAFALYPQLFTTNASGTVTNGDIAYPTLIVNLLPSGLVGLMIAALLAALMGGMASVFNSASTLVTLDFYKKLRPEREREAARVRRAHRHRRAWSCSDCCGCRSSSCSARSSTSICRACRPTSVRRSPRASSSASCGRG